MIHKRLNSTAVKNNLQFLDKGLNESLKHTTTNKKNHTVNPVLYNASSSKGKTNIRKKKLKNGGLNYLEISEVANKKTPKVETVEDFKKLSFVQEYTKLNPGININLNYEDIKKKSFEIFKDNYLEPSKKWWYQYLKSINNSNEKNQQQQPEQQQPEQLTEANGKVDPVLEFKKYFNISKSSAFNLQLKEINEFLIDSNKCTILETPHTKHFMIDWLETINEPLNIGDLCVLKSQVTGANSNRNLNSIMTCIGLPNDLKDPRYTFANTDGSITFEYKNSILLKIPSILHLPVSSQNDKTAPGNNTKLYNIDNVQDAQNDHENLINGYFKNDIIHKYSLPVILRQILISYFSTYFLNGSSRISKMVEIHLQNYYLEKCQMNINSSTLGKYKNKIAKNGDIIDGNLDTPFQVSFLEIVEYIQYKIISKKHYDDKNDIYKGKVSIDVLLATFQALCKNKNQHFGEFQHDRSSLVPISITFIPKNYSLEFDNQIIEILNSQKNKLGNENNTNNNINKKASLIDDFTRHLKKIGNGTSENTPHETTKFKSIMNVLVGYLNGNLKNKYATNVVSLICNSLMTDITKDSIYKLLMKLNVKDSNPQLAFAENEKVIKNPLLLNHDLNIYSKTKNNENMFYDSIKKEDILLDKENEQLIEFNDPVYCIDSDTAHEIDDGVALKHVKDNRYTLYIHIAHPSRFLPIEKKLGNESSSSESSIINTMFEIAKKRSFTTYLPDMVVPMLPEVFVQEHDLRNDTARSLCFQIDITLKDENVFSQKIHKTSELVLHHDTFKVVDNYKLTNLPKKIHYTVVDEMLNERNNQQTSNSLHIDNIKKLYKISLLLKNKRIDEKSAIVFGEGFNKGLPKINPDTEDVEFYNGETTKSNILVSELMILANSLSGKFLADNKIPAIYRSYKNLNLDPSLKIDNKVIQSSADGNNNNSDPDITKLQLYSSLFNSSTYTLDYTQGQSIMGIDHYATVTSPLRRYPDVINHLQILSFMKNNGKTYYSYDELKHILYTNILPRYLIIRDQSNKHSKYLTLKYWKKNFTGSQRDQKLPIIISSVPNFNKCMFVSLDYKYASGIIHLKQNQHFDVGHIIENCKITKIDAFDNILEVEVD